MIKVIREVYFVNNLKVNMFIENDFIDLKQIIIDVVKSTIYIESYNVIVDINVKTVKFVIRERM